MAGCPHLGFVMQCVVCSGDAERLRRMRELGVVWRLGHLPRYTAGMTPDECAEADRLYDAMSEEFVKYLLRGK